MTVANYNYSEGNKIKTMANYNYSEGNKIKTMANLIV